MKASLSFANKIWWAVVRSRIWPTQVDNTLALDHTVLIASIIATYDIVFAHCIVEKIHERALKRSTSFLFPCLIHKLYIEAGQRS